MLPSLRCMTRVGIGGHLLVFLFVTLVGCGSQIDVVTGSGGSENSSGSGGAAAVIDMCPESYPSPGDSCAPDGLDCGLYEREDGCPVHLSCFVHVNPAGYWLKKGPTKGSPCEEPGQTCEYQYVVGDNLPSNDTAVCDDTLGWQYVVLE